MWKILKEKRNKFAHTKNQHWHRQLSTLDSYSISMYSSLVSKTDSACWVWGGSRWELETLQRFFFIFHLFFSTQQWSRAFLSCVIYGFFDVFHRHHTRSDSMKIVCISVLFFWAWARVEEDDVCQRGEIWKIYYTTINIFSFLPQWSFHFAFRWDFSACVVHGLPFLALPMEWGAHTFNLWNWTFNVSFPQQKYTKFRRFVINFFRGFFSFTPRKIQQFVFLSRAPRNVFAA